MLFKKGDRDFLGNGRGTIISWTKEFASKAGKDILNVMDFGCKIGTDLCNVRQNLPDHQLNLIGIDITDEYLDEVSKKGITAIKLNMERDIIPVEDGSIDIIILNNILEHTREIWWIFAEISRILSMGGLIIVGFPNLGYFYNRIRVLLGRQPANAAVYGPHVRVFTYFGFKEFIEKLGIFKIVKFTGADFYPFPRRLCPILSRLFPRMSYGLFFNVIKMKNLNFLKTIENQRWASCYFQGEAHWFR